MCGRLVNLDTVARVLAEYYHLKTETQLAALDEALSRVPAETVGGGHKKDHVADPGKMVGDLISRQAAIGIVEFECGEWRGLASTIVKAIEQLPSAQPEIIRCKDCKHNPKYEWFGCPMCHLSEKQRPETAWCWKGERKDGKDGDNE